jgi:predicted dienelactone hydrolase
MRKLLVGCLIIWLAPANLWAAAVGVTTLNSQTSGQELKIMVWYPAQAVASSQAFDYYGLNHGQAVWQAPKLVGHYPLVIFSHGLGMCSYQSAFLLENLASHGYIVAAPDHNDAAMCHIGGGSDVNDCQLVKAFIRGADSLDTSVQYLFPDKLHYLNDPAYRPQQISLVIDKLLADPGFGPLINPQQIGVTGHSFGGWTAEAVAGAEIDCTNPADYAPDVCEATPEDLATARNNRQLCCQPAYQGKKSQFRDKRVKATIALGPGSFIFPHYDAWQVETPIMFIGGDHFEVDYWNNIQLPYELTEQQPKYLLVFREVGHMTASDLVFHKPGAPLLRQFWHYQRKQELYKFWSLGFFQSYLRGASSWLQQNTRRPCQVKLYFQEN